MSQGLSIYMLYDVSKIDFEKLIGPITRASDTLARLDERISHSPFKTGFLERQDFTDAVSSLWVDGELIHIEDLVLHDAHMNTRPPTHEIGIASRILRSRRLILSNEPQWALSAVGISRLRGSDESLQTAALAGDGRDEQPTSKDVADDDEDGHTSLDDELAAIDRLIARSSATLDSITTDSSSARIHSPETIFHDPDWNEPERLNEWRAVLKKTSDLPGILRTVIALDAWNKLEVLQRNVWLGRQLAAAVLRADNVVLAHLPALNTGLRAVARERRHSLSRTERLVAFMDGIHEGARIGLKEHDRLLNAKNRMERRLLGRRSNSRLPELIALVLAKPVVSTSMIVDALGTTPQGAVGLANQLELREMTGRGRFRAWGII